MKIIDLSVIVNEKTPVYPGDPQTMITPAGIFEKNGYCDFKLTLGNHLGTHIDAPMHMVEEGESLDKLPIETFVGRGKYIPVNGEFNIEEVKNSGIEEGDIVLFHTGMGAKYYEPDYFKSFPVMSEAIAQYLIDVRVKMVGLDTCGADNSAENPIHKQLLGNGVLIIENLTNLEQLRGSDFTIYALPLKLDIDSAPARVIAVVE